MARLTGMSYMRGAREGFLCALCSLCVLCGALVAGAWVGRC